MVSWGGFVLVALTTSFTQLMPRVNKIVALQTADSRGHLVVIAGEGHDDARLDAGLDHHDLGALAEHRLARKVTFTGSPTNNPPTALAAATSPTSGTESTPARSARTRRRLPR